MLSGAFETVQGAFGRIFLIGSFLPVLAVACASLAVALEVTWDLSQAVSEAAAQPTFTQVVLAFAGLVVVTFAAYVMNNFQYVITRAFEGYWPSRRFKTIRQDLHRRRAAWLEAEAKAAFDAGRIAEALEWQDRRFATYPPPNHLDLVMPTKLGNVLRTSEVYPLDRYGIDAVIIWPRLRPFVPAEQAEVLDERKVAVDSMLKLTVLLRAFALIWCVLLALTTTRWDLFLICAAAWPAAWLTYRNAVEAAIAYSEQVRATFDLHRLELIKALGLAVPADAAAERDLWGSIAQFYARNLPLSAPPSTT